MTVVGRRKFQNLLIQEMIQKQACGLRLQINLALEYKRWQPKQKITRLQKTFHTLF